MKFEKLEAIANDNKWTDIVRCAGYFSAVSFAFGRLLKIVQLAKYAAEHCSCDGTGTCMNHIAVENEIEALESESEEEVL